MSVTVSHVLPLVIIRGLSFDPTAEITRITLTFEAELKLFLILKMAINQLRHTSRVQHSHVLSKVFQMDH